MKGVQCYELFGGIALKIHTFSFSFSLRVTPREGSGSMSMQPVGCTLWCSTDAVVRCDIYVSNVLKVQQFWLFLLYQPNATEKWESWWKTDTDNVQM